MWDRFKGCGAREVLHCIVLRFLGTSVLQGKFTLNMDACFNHGRTGAGETYPACSSLLQTKLQGLLHCCSVMHLVQRTRPTKLAACFTDCTVHCSLLYLHKLHSYAFGTFRTGTLTLHAG